MKPLKDKAAVVTGGTFGVGRGMARSPMSEPTMEPRPIDQEQARVFEIVRTTGLALPDVEATTKYDGSPVLKVGGSFMAGLATHRSAEPGTLVIRAEYDERERFMEDEPKTYYITDYYRSYPVVLVRLARVEPDALRDLLAMSRRLTLPKARIPASREQLLKPAGRRVGRSR